MKLDRLKEIVLKNASVVNIKRGKELISKNEVVKLTVKKIDGIYNLYGNFNGENKLNNVNTHVKIDVKNEKVVFVKCTCSIYGEGSNNQRIYMCEHIVATILKFIYGVRENLKAKSRNKELQDERSLENKTAESSVMERLSELSFVTEHDITNMGLKNSAYENKEELNLQVEIRENHEKSREDFFNIKVFLGKDKMYPVMNLKECMKAILDKKLYKIGQGLVYNAEKHFFSQSSLSIMEFIYQYYLIYEGVSLSNFNLNKELLRKLLSNFKEEKVMLNYKYLNYVCCVKNEDMNLSFTLKEDGNSYVLTTRKITPIPLTSKMDVFLYNRVLYLPSERQIEIYKIYYDELKKNKLIRFSKSMSDKKINMLVKSLGLISKNIFYDEKIIKRLQNNIEVFFKMNKDSEVYKCDVEFASPFGRVSYKDSLNMNNEIVCPKKSIIHLEGVLNHYRFYFIKDTFKFLGTEEEYYTFLKYGLDVLKKEGIIKYEPVSSSYFNLYSGEMKDIKFNVQGDLNYNFGFEIEGLNKENYDLAYQSYKEGKSFFKTDDDIYVDLSSKEFKEAVKIIESLELDLNSGSDSYDLDLNKALYLGSKLDGNKFNEEKDIKETIENLQGMTKDKTYKIPQNLNAKLREYQVKGYNWFRNLKSLNFGGILCDEMGLGKTIQTITFLLSEHNKRKNLSLIIAPTSLIYNWSNEINKFAPSLKTIVCSGSKSARQKILLEKEKYDIIITTYGTYRNDFENYEGITFNNVILDEGHNINNSKAITTNIIKKIKADNKFLLTGTPILNNLSELWSLFDFIMPGYLYDEKTFTDRFIKNDNYDELKLLINPYILRRKKEDVLTELPDKIERKYIVENTAEQNKIYKGFVDKIKEAEKKGEIDNASMFAFITKLRQICLEPRILNDSYSGGSGKFNCVKELIQQYVEGGHKILIFSQFTSALKLLSRDLEDNEVCHYYLDGSTKSEDRIAMCDKFNQSDEKKVFLISLKAGGTGLNLTGADTVIHLDPWWNTAIEDQASDRAHRIGQKSCVEVIKLISRNTIEEKMINMQEEKRELINTVITDELSENSIVSKLNKKELMDLL